MTANVHTFGFLESFTTYDYEFLHSNCIEIAIPSWFKTGILLCRWDWNVSVCV